MQKRNQRVLHQFFIVLSLLVGHTFTWTWADHYNPSVTDTITLTINSVVEYPALPGQGYGYLLGTILSPAQGIPTPYNVALTYIPGSAGAQIYSGIAVTDGIPSGGGFTPPVLGATGPGMKDLQAFGDTWHDIFKHNVAVTHAYWDCYIVKFKGITGNAPLTDEVDEQTKKRIRSAGNQWFERRRTQ